DGSSAAIKLSAPLAPSEYLESFRIAPDSARVVYLTAQECHERLERYSVPIDGSAPPQRLNGRTRGGCRNQDEQGELEYEISADGSRVVYVTDEDRDGVRELYSVPIEAEGTSVGFAWRQPRIRSIRLSAPFTGYGEVADEYDGGFTFALSPDGREVVYRAGQEAPDVLELFRVPIDGGAPPVKLNARLALGEQPGDVLDAAINPDGASVVYRADLEVDERFDLFSVSIAGGTSRK